MRAPPGWTWASKFSSRRASVSRGRGNGSRGFGRSSLSRAATGAGSEAIRGGDARGPGSFVLSRNHALRQRLPGRQRLKLPAARVLELFDKDTTESFAPAGRTFKEWTGVLGDTPEGWAPLIEEAVAFARCQDNA